MQTIVVVNNPGDWDFNIEGVEVASARGYLTSEKYNNFRNARVFNLCRSYKYQSTGYYVSLLAEARGHRPFPNISTIQDLKSPSIIRGISDDLDELIQRSLKDIKSQNFVLSIYFGRNVAERHREVSRQLYNLFQSPMLRANFYRNKKWVIQNISPIPVNEIPEAHKPFVEKFAAEYFEKKRIYVPKRAVALYDLAILASAEEEHPPSDKKALKKFIEAAAEEEMRAYIIDKEEYGSLGEYDALFIRETTSVNDHTYRFARKAYTEGLAVIDDPFSIIRCTNKVYLAELLTNSRIPSPKSVIIHKDNPMAAEAITGFPCVLKKPDSSFSRGVLKIHTMEELKQKVNEMLEFSDLLIAQEFVSSEFDWRIGVLDKKPLYASKYYMAKNHWQIINWGNNSGERYGEFETMAVEDVPANIVNSAVRAASLIGDGLYGVDLKVNGNKVYVIEINDNPSIDSGIEDKALKDELYRRIMRSFRKRIETIRHGKNIQI